MKVSVLLLIFNPGTHEQKNEQRKYKDTNREVCCSTWPSEYHFLVFVGISQLWSGTQSSRLKIIHHGWAWLHNKYETLPDERL